MKSIVLGPEQVREALDPKNYPKRHIFLVSIDGDIYCCDLDEGWLVFRKPQNVTYRDWCVALRGAISSMQHYILVAKSIHDELREMPEGATTYEPPSTNVLVFEKGRCPVCAHESDPDSYPYCCELHRRRSRGY